MVEPQQSSSVVANQPFKLHPGMITKLFGAKRLTAKAPQIVCPDRYTLCPSNNTCCLNKSLDYDCCPFVDGVCCSDQEHCCPLGYSCNSDGTCTQQHVVCPDKSFCPLKNICCLLGSGKYNCCPTPYGRGSCCADGEHCCALGYSCNSDNTCKQTGIVRRMHVHWIIHAVCLTQETMDAVPFLMLSAVLVRSVVHQETLVTQMERAATRKRTHHQLINNLSKRALDLRLMLLL